MRNIATILARSLEQRWQKYSSELRRCKQNTSEEAVHDLRVATRRLIATLMLVERVHPDRRVGRIRKRLKRLFDSLSPLRDTQVQRLTIEPRTREYPDLATLATIVRVREHTLMRSLKKRIRSVETNEMRRDLHVLKRDLGRRFASPSARRVGMMVVQGAAAAAFAKAAFLREKIVPTRAATLHRHRIAFKKFRYSVEAMLPLLPSITKAHLKAMDAYQTSLGNIQDAEVMERLVERFLATKPPAVKRRLVPFRRQLAAEKKRLTREYLRRARAFSKFWNSVQH